MSERSKKIRQLSLPDEVQAEAEALAERAGLSFGDFARQAVMQLVLQARAAGGWQTVTWVPAGETAKN